jgi:hypothetical protein
MPTTQPRRFALLLLLLALPLSASAHWVPSDLDDETFKAKYYTVGAPKVEEITDPAELQRLKMQPQTPFENRAIHFEVSPNFVSLETVVNLGKSLWNLVSAGKPVANLKTDAANALPEGIRTWQELEGWKTPISKTFRVSYQNGFGSDVVSFTYRVLATHGGSYKGQGQYLTHVTVVPANVEVAWGYTFSANVAIPSITNAGTLLAPVAAAQVQVNWTVDTFLRHTESAHNYYVTGDGEFTNLSEDE